VGFHHIAQPTILHVFSFYFKQLCKEAHVGTVIVMINTQEQSTQKSVMNTFQA